MIPVYPDFYNDVFGPIMQPFSSAHTAGPCRMGFFANCLLNEEPVDVKVLMNPGSTWQSTFGRQNEDLAFLSGCTGHLPHDAILFKMREYCREHGITYKFSFEPVPETKHHSGAKLILTGKSGKTITMINESLGGGLARTALINGYPLAVNGDTYVLLVFDEEEKLNPDFIQSSISNRMEILDSGVSVKENEKGQMFWFKMSDEPVDVSDLVQEAQVECLKPFVAVITRNDKKPQLFADMVEWRRLADEQGKGLADIAIEYEMNSSGWSREEVIAYMRDVIKPKMHRATHAIYDMEIDPPESAFSEPRYKIWQEYMSNNKSLFTGSTIAKVMRYTYAAMTPIPGVEFVPGPMGTGGGIIYATLCAVQEDFGYSDEDLIRGLFVAAGVGAICFTHSEPGGGNVGCMGEIGMCGAMATAAVAEMAGSTPKQVENAAAMSMMVAVGWPCDPTSGAKGLPCGSRGIMAACMAPVYVEIARSGQDAVFPFHEVLQVADTVGRSLPPTCRGSHLGGHCASPTGKACREAFQAWHATLK